MRRLLTALLLFSSLSYATIDLPKFANPKCVLGLDFQFTTDKDNNILTGRHKDGLFRLFSWALTEDKKYYVVILKADEAPLKLSMQIAVNLNSNNELSCRVSRKYPDGSVVDRVKKIDITGVVSTQQDQRETLSREAFTLCYDMIFTREFRSQKMCQ